MLDFNGYDAPLIEEMGHELASIHRSLKWEIGPSAHARAKYQLVVSPNRSWPLAPVADEVAAQAPSMDSWIVLGRKPPKTWARTLRVHTRSGWHSIDCNEWRYRLHAVGDDQYEVVVSVPSFQGSMPPRSAVMLALESELGEAVLMERIVAASAEEGAEDFDATHPFVDLRRDSRLVS